jgi:multiple sugar transport system substrate-binding protein
MGTMNARVNRRTLTRAGLGGATLLAGSQAGLRPRPARAAQEGTQISFMNWDPIADTPLEAAINAFQEQSGITVEVQATPASGEYETRMRTMLASGAPPDIMRINDDFVRGYSLADQLLDLRPFFERDGINPEDYGTHAFTFPVQPDGQHTAWTIGTQPAVVVYNVNLFEDAGVPLPPTTWSGENWTWDDFLEAAQALTVPGERWGALVIDDTSSETVYPVNNGETTGIYSVDGTEFTLANPQAVEAVQWYADLSCVHEVQPPWSELQQDDAGEQLFVAGRIGMMQRTFGISSYLHRNVSDFVWDVAPVPAKEDQQTIATLIVFCIPKTAQDPDAAWELLKFLGGFEGGRIFAEAGYFLPANREALALIQPDDAQPPAHLNIVTEAVEHSTNENFSQYVERARQIYKPQLDLIYLCQQPAAEALPAIREQVEQALAGEI